MPRIQRMIIDDQSTVYHAWDVEPYPADNEWASHSLAMLWRSILAAFSKKIIGKVGQQLKRPSQSFGWFTKHNFVTTAKNFKHLAFNGEFLWQRTA